VLSALAIALSALACTVVAPVVPPPGLLYQSYEAPLSLHGLQKPGSKRGTASTQNILGLFSWGDASVHTAAMQGGIQTIQHADYEFYSVLGIYSRYTTVVHGD
jgi:hypothetical protein